ncbi:MAG: Maf family protein, partial [Pseudomonadales bacterium]
MRLILASRSPRRAELLAQLGLVFEVRAADVDETWVPGEDAAGYVLRLARAKARAVRSRIREVAGDGTAPGVVIIGADTSVVLDDRVLGKPGNEAEGVAMLLALSGRTHQVMTGVAVCDDARIESLCVTTRVRFRAIDVDEARAYWNTGEAADKAGGYGIQGIGG